MNFLSDAISEQTIGQTINFKIEIEHKGNREYRKSSQE